MAASNLPAYTMLIAEDDPDVRLALHDYFELLEYRVDVAEDGHEALDKLRTVRDYDIVLLDVTMPGLSGFDVLTNARKMNYPAPFLLLTGRGEQENILKGFNLGADDYVVKPFDVDELAARVKAILLRTLPPDRAPMQVFHIGDLDINFSTHEARRGTERVNFTALEFDLLRYFYHNRDRIITRRQLLRDIWNIDYDIETRTVDRHIASVRKKIEKEPRRPRHIETVYGVGYKFTL